MENTIEYIERYFNDSLTKEEKDHFEKKRSEDKEFDRLVKTYQKANEIIGAAARERLKAQLDLIGQQQMSTDAVETFIRFRFIRKYWLSVAASVIFISAIAYFALNSILKPGTPETLADLYEVNFAKPGIDLVITRGSEDNANELTWNSALELYNKSQYEPAIDRFNELLKSPSFGLKSAAYFYAGICFMQMNVPDSASLYLSNVSLSSAFSDEAQWYMALNHINAGNTSEASRILKQIKETGNHPRQMEASRLLKKLQKLDNTSPGE